MTFAALLPLAGYSPVSTFGLTNDTEARHPMGTIRQVVSTYWGGAEVVYARAGAAIAQYAACMLDPSFSGANSQWRHNMIEVTNTANMGRPVYVAMLAMGSGNFGWFVRRGYTPVKSDASVAITAAIGITAAGTLGAVANGKQIVNCRVSGVATTTVAKANSTANAASRALTVSNSDGWFPGIYLSGTGIASGTTVTAISPDGRTVTLSADTTAAVAGTVTGTYNNGTIYYNVVHLDCPFAQGQVS